MSNYRVLKHFLEWLYGNSLVCWNGWKKNYVIKYVFNYVILLGGGRISLSR